MTSLVKLSFRSTCPLDVHLVVHQGAEWTLVKSAGKAIDAKYGVFYF